MNEIDVIKTYDELHKIPELGFQEFKTATYLADKLEALGYEVTRNIGGTGVIGILRGSEVGPVMLVRADMDALPFVVEGKDVAIHACGHDAHSSMVLAAASRLVGKIKKGTLKILFQQGEGSLAIIDAGFVDDVDLALGVHIRPIQDAPYGKMAPAVCHAASTFVDIKVTGLQCHASRPHLGVNAIDAAVAGIVSMNAIKMNPIIPWSAKVTKFHGGGLATNIIPEVAEITLDVRAQTNATMEELLEKIRKAFKGAALGFGAEVEILTKGGVIPAAELDSELTAEVAECITEVIGKENLIPNLINPGGEDFHYFVQKRPHIKAAYFGVGCDCQPGLHHPAMKLDKTALPSGVEVIVKMVERKLG
ncbi:MAG: amidohydrolase [Acidaminococcaceae bacterium]